MHILLARNTRGFLFEYFKRFYALEWVIEPNDLFIRKSIRMNLFAESRFNLYPDISFYDNTNRQLNSVIKIENNLMNNIKF